MAYTMRREVSLDWHPNAVDTSQNSAWGSKDTILGSSKSQPDLIDASIQVDLSGTCLIYDSDEDMQNKKKNTPSINLERSRKGHPLYSKEDIKEQYCISNKQLKVLQRRRSWKLFTSCLSPEDNSIITCSPGSVISCVQKRKNDDSLRRPYSLPQNEKASIWSPKSDSGVQKAIRKNGEAVKAGQSGQDDEFADTYFRKRPKSFCLADPKVKFSWLNNENKEPIGESRILKVGSRTRLSTSYEQTSNYNSRKERACLKSIGQSRSLDLLDNDEKVDTSDSRDSTVSSWNKRKILTGSAGILDSGGSNNEDKRKKHVSFDSTSILRGKLSSNTLDDLEDDEITEGPNATSTPMIQRSDRSPMTPCPSFDFTQCHDRSHQNDVKERLMEQIRCKERYSTNDTSQTDDSLDAWSLSQQNTSSYSSIKSKKMTMKTQSTQTMPRKKSEDSTNKDSSPKLNKKNDNRRRPTTMQLQSVQTPNNSSSSVDNETIENIIVTKYVLNGRKNKARPKSLPITPIDNGGEKEIMVSFKPQQHTAPPADVCNNQSESVTVGNKLCASLEEMLKPVMNDGVVEYTKTSVTEPVEDGTGAKGVIYKEIIKITGNIKPSTKREEKKEENADGVWCEAIEQSSDSLCNEILAVVADIEEEIATGVADDSVEEIYSPDQRDSVSIDINSLLETSPPSTSYGLLITDSPIDPPPSFACESPTSIGSLPSTNQQPNRAVVQSFSLDLPSMNKVNFCPQSVSLDNILLMSPESKSSNEYYTASSADEFVVSHQRRHSASPSVSLDKITDCLIGNEFQTIEESVDYDSSLRRSSSSSRKGTLKRDKHFEYEVDQDLCNDEVFAPNVKSRCPKRMASTGEASDDHTLTLGDDDSDESLTMIPPAVDRPVEQVAVDERKTASMTPAVDECRNKMTKKEICSPETDSSSSHFTGRESSKSGGSVETLKSESDQEQNDTTSVEYVTATDNSHRSRIRDEFDNCKGSSGKTSIDSMSSNFGSPKDARNKKAESNGGKQEQHMVCLQEAINNHKQQQRRHFLKERMARLERRRKQIEKGMCSTSTESSNSGSYVIDSFCLDESVTLDEEPHFEQRRNVGYPIEVNVKTKGPSEVVPTCSVVDEDPTKDEAEEERKCAENSSSNEMCGSGGAKLKKHSSTDGLAKAYVFRDKRRTRSASRSPDDSLSNNIANDRGLIRDSPMAHSHTGVFPIENGRKSSSRLRSDAFSSGCHLMNREARRRRERIYSKSASTESASVRSTASLSSSHNTTYHNGSSLSITTIEGADDDDVGVHSESYRSANWLYINSRDETAVWNRTRLISDGKEKRELQRSSSLESTTSEKEFGRKYQSITHRMVHRRASIEMFRRMAKGGRLEPDKCVTIERKNQEFGFRINGSRPVVVSAIEPDTPAEMCNLEIGDIIISINDTNVIDHSHSDVVKLAHTGMEVLTLQIARMIHLVNPSMDEEKDLEVINRLSGYVYKLSENGTKWRRRWLSLDQETKILLFYKSNLNTEPSGIIYLPHYKPPEQVTIAEHPFAFQLNTHAPGGSPLTFYANKQSEASRWMCQLTDVLTTVQIDPFVNKSVRNACLPPTSIDKPDCQGYLGNLCSQKGNKTAAWRRRYYILKDACIYIYTDYYAENAIGVYHLHGYRVQTCVISGKRSTFEALPPNQKLKHFQFLAESDIEKKKWLAAFEYSIDRWMKL